MDTYLCHDHSNNICTSVQTLPHQLHQPLCHAQSVRFPTVRDAYLYASMIFEQDAYLYASMIFEQDAYLYASMIFEQDAYLYVHIYI
jgi:hypothetical protein